MYMVIDLKVLVRSFNINNHIYIYIILITYPIHIISYPYIHHLNQTCSIKQQKQQHYSNSTFLIHIMVVYIAII